MFLTLTKPLTSLPNFIQILYTEIKNSTIYCIGEQVECNSQKKEVFFDRWLLLTWIKRGLSNYPTVVFSSAGRLCMIPVNTHEVFLNSCHKTPRNSITSQNYSYKLWGFLLSQGCLTIPTLSFFWLWTVSFCPISKSLPEKQDGTWSWHVLPHSWCFLLDMTV